MSAERRFEVSTKDATDEVAPEVLNLHLIQCIVLFVLFMGVTFLLCIALATANPGFANISNEHRLNFMGWSLLAAMAPGIIFPVKAKSSMFWALYSLLLISVVCMICA